MLHASRLPRGSIFRGLPLGKTFRGLPLGKTFRGLPRGSTLRGFTLQRTRRAFTLIEILIVVAIISILASMVLVGLGPLQRQGRDTRRIGDLRQVQNALEFYFNKCGHYPGGVACVWAAGTDTWAELTTSLTGASIGTNQIPNDPSSGRNYFYGSTDGSSYVIGATLEDPNNPNLNQDVDGASVQGVSCADPVYCVQF